MTREATLLAAMHAASLHWQRQGHCVSSYLRHRGLPEIAADPASWDLGYASMRWTELTDHLRERGFTDDVIVEAGLAIRKHDGRLIDRFRGRLMFLVRSADTKRVVGAIGRDITNRPTTVRYLDTPTTAIYTKGEHLYRLHDHTADSPTLFLTEGPLDALAMRAAGHCAAAVGGTVLTTARVQALRLRHFGPRIVLAFDADTAGQHATRRAYLDLAPRFSLIDYLVMPEHQDPLGHLARADVRHHLAIRPAADLIIDQALGNPAASDLYAASNAARRATRALLKLPVHEWPRQIQRISTRCYITDTLVKHLIVDEHDPSPTTAQQTPSRRRTDHSSSTFSPSNERQTRAQRRHP